MLDGEGNVRITDFGLAGLAESISGDDVRSGTPAYMSPEQLAGHEVTARSDVYALGLVLYELFTGQRAFRGRTVAELTRQHREEPPIHPSELVSGLSLAVEDVILRCLAKDPRQRPPSAVAVSAMLAGEDALAAALAAGETPSPEMVAAARGGEGLSAGAAWACLTIALVGLVAVPFVLPRFELLRAVPVDKPPAVLEERSRTLLRELGHPDAETDSAFGFRADVDYFRHVFENDHSPNRWRGLASGEPAALQFWYRQATRPLVAINPAGVVSWLDPPLTDSGMGGVRLDLTGRLVYFYSIPPQLEPDPPPPPHPTDWSRLLAEAELAGAALKPVTPRWTPAFYCDERVAWEGPSPLRPDLPIRVEAAAYRGRPVSFVVIYPWTRPNRMQPFPMTGSQIAAQVLFTALVVGLILAGAVMARQHLLRGRGDLRGATRVALFTLLLGLTTWVLAAHHVADRSGESRLAMVGTAAALFIAAILWLFYLAIEPYARRLWPAALISWARLLAGQIRDARVGRDTLVGVAFGIGLVAAIVPIYLLPAWLGSEAPPPRSLDYDALLGTRNALLPVFGLPLDGLLVGLGVLLVLTLARLLLRNTGAAIGAEFAVILLIQILASQGSYWMRVPLGLLVVGLLNVALLRFGLLSAVVMLATVNLVLNSPLTADLTSWEATPTILILLVVGTLALWGWRTARGTPFPSAHDTPPA
jgi:serine/threonine-protein kinase